VTNLFMFSRAYLIYQDEANCATEFCSHL